MDEILLYRHSSWLLIHFFFFLIYDCAYLILFFKLIFWSIVDLQCCVSGVQQSESVTYIHTHTYTYIHSLLDSFPT